MAQKVSMQQIADRLGVSKYTVSQALAGKDGISEATRRQVVAMARALGYQSPPGKAGRDGAAGRGEAVLRSGATGGVPGAACGADADREREQEGGLIDVGLPERHAEEPYFWQRIRQGIEAGCRQYGYRARYFTFRESGGGRPLCVPDGGERAAGYIIAGSCPAEALLELKRTGLPLVLVDHEEPVAFTDAVLNANAEAGRMACHQLMSQGCESIAFVGRDSFAVSFRERWWGCRIAIDDLNGKRTSGYAALKLDRSPRDGGKTAVQLRKWTIPYGSSPWRAALARRLASAAAEKGLPDGFVCANDDIALELVRLLAVQDVRVPGGCRVVGIDNTAASGAAPVPLTTVDLAKEWLGIRAVETFVRRLERPEAPPEKVVLAARLIVRQSG
ncbi:LacI family DNA-binding transcriptional regulator [Paenibacillus humicola]|uniref:LacI family DNA-binding transcriptional regulator n=1 Tax=Paenibacillus humicola TaxID=3110540 RepID=UPI00237BA46A|nr:LacI family DNA-binding transcriptional regulator [Paenibacillus humicola]